MLLKRLSPISVLCCCCCCTCRGCGCDGCGCDGCGCDACDCCDDGDSGGGTDGDCGSVGDKVLARTSARRRDMGWVKDEVPGRGDPNK